ncbi:hypothetical protein [Streptomyces spectabilis]|uniref:Uncharacterized protein n=1 Tax=Streptomyces spectabilis TaxID=68270 RepID=A0A516RC97_STRST|nr:hypothetical protein [Streptomyces spectabilis]QDQ13276.1 hypothetical protein FH965_24125 [Streptomyces spectabilis]
MRQTQDTRWYAVPAPERRWYAVPAPERDEWWWLAPAVGTVAALLGACLRAADAELPFVWLALTCVPGFLLVAGSWCAARTRERRGVRVSLAAAGCVLTYLTVKVFLAALYVLAILMWLRQGDG